MEDLLTVRVRDTDVQVGVYTVEVAGLIIGLTRDAPTVQRDVLRREYVRMAPELRRSRSPGRGSLVGHKIKQSLSHLEKAGMVKRVGPENQQLLVTDRAGLETVVAAWDAYIDG